MKEQGDICFKEWDRINELVSWTDVTNYHCEKPLWLSTLASLDSVLKSRDHHFADKGPYSQNCGLLSSHVWMTIKKAKHQRIDYWRRLLRVLWTAKRSSQSILKEISPEYSLERLMLKLKLQYFGPPNAKSWLIGKDLDAGKDWRQEEKRAIENEMVGWPHWLNGYELGQTPGDRDGQGGWVCCSLWGCKESDTI